MDYIDAAMRMLGRLGSGQQAAHVTNAHAVTGTAVGDSEDGTVLVDLGGDVTTGDGSQYVEVQTDANVLEGDTVDVLLVGEAGRGMSPVIYGVPGGGDRMAAAVADARDMASNAETLAEQAEAVASATGQHFWPDDDGVHITEVTQTEWNDSTSSNYHSGANVILNAIGQLFRNGVNNLLALLPSAGETYTETFTLEEGWGAGFVTLQRTPDVVSSVKVDGVEKTDYSLWGNNVNFVSSVSGPATIEVSYRIGGSSIAVFDGLGNAAENVLASFGVAGATIGYERGGHVKVSSSSLSVMNGGTPIAQFGEITKFYAGGGEVMRIVPGEIDFSASDDASFIRFNEICSINSDVVTVGGSDLGSMNIYADELTLETKLKFPDSTALPNAGTSTDFYVVGITNFDNGGVLKYKNLANMQSWIGGGVTTGTVTIGAAASSWGSADLRKYAHVVTLNLNSVHIATAIASGSTSGTIATVPAGFRPPSAFRFSVPINNTGNRANVWGVVGGGGVIQIANRSDYTIPADFVVHICATYIVN